MKNYKKVAVAAVSIVMAGTMALPMVACGNNKPSRVKQEVNVNWDEKPNLEAAYSPKVDANDKLTVDNGINLSMNVGNQNSTRPQSISYKDVELSGSVTMPDGKSYSSGDLKPAWKSLSQTLNIGFTDNFQNLGSAAQITTPAGANELGKYDVITGSLDEINKNSDKFLNLNNYMYYMPNYQAFLKANEVTLFSLTGDENRGMYAAPYFDGNDDIEKYDMVKREWVRAILDADSVAAATTTFAEQAAAKSSQSAVGTVAAVKPYMGTTGNWLIETTDPSDDTKTVNVKVNYDAALTAAKDANSALGKALTDAGVTSLASLTSGNIVDLQNAAINAKAGAVTGAQLANILRAYIDVAYTTEGGAKFYTKRSDVFNGKSGAWDVDLLVGIMRCVVTGDKLFDSKTQAKGLNTLYGLSGRQDTTQRTVDLYALGGELYGVRGLESRFEYTYFDKDGGLRDSRQDAEAYDLLANMGAMADEGLLYVVRTGSTDAKTTPASGKTSFANGDSIQSFMLHDYVQTQTKPAIDGSAVNSDYDFAPIATPVSKWDTDSDGTHETIMRFTESWRSVKNTGFCIPKEAVANKPEKLSAILAFIDYLFSSDGQILMTYGARSTTGNTNPDGWWYATESSKKLSDVADLSVAATNYSVAQYTVKDAEKQNVFVYQGKVYEGMKYADRNIPIMTKANSDFYLGKEVNGIVQNKGDVKVSAIGSYTDYARKIVGTTLPIGNKDQGFEYQATAECGLEGAANVAAAINNGTIKHVKLSLYTDESSWYRITPTALPYTAAQRTTLSTDAAQTNLSSMYFYNSSSTNYYTNVFTDLVYYGFDATHNICGYENNGGMKASGAEYVTFLNGAGMTQRVSIMKSGWQVLSNLYYGK